MYFDFLRDERHDPKSSRLSTSSDFVSFGENLYGPVGGKIKRVFDLCAVSLIFLLLSPLLLGIFLILRAFERGPVFYGHERIGFNGKPFLCWKFRSMAINGEEILEKYFETHPYQREIWDQEFKLENDPRVTAVGAVLRSSSLDELPQLFNIIKGDMSLVGPRPVTLKELENYGEAKELYLACRPGITGLWQVSGRSNASYEERVKYDIFYFEKWTFLLDLKLLFLTIPAVALAKGAR
ncbi:sugar transferase [Donghicola sp. C2-DW-16]|uniref:Sugar transferase n=1 Tax=Donghicola mangrovi TaxID=2729614 RepID=A0ABX2PL16_9RHOB|nr:sugar transferase [Donghicola mangrovi]NVO29194.1 sugar transferase [Donghicola mangrovi]